MKNHPDTVTFPNRLTTGFAERFCPDPFATYDLVELYAEYNAHYFGGDLPALRTATLTDSNDEERIVTADIQWDGRFRKVYGKYYFASKQIRLARHMVHDHVKVKSTLIHEMLHKYLHSRGEDDGIEGHGPNFIREAKRINDLCRERGVPYRVEFYDEEITREEPAVFAELLGVEIACFRDLDLARKVKRVCDRAFDNAWTYNQ